MSKLSIVVPVYWNSDTLMLLYEDMKEKILHKLEDYEIVFVDDGSGDNSWEIMNRIREMDQKVKLVKLSRNFGEHGAQKLPDPQPESAILLLGVFLMMMTNYI